MEYILYVLILVSMHSNGSINFYEPRVYDKEAVCEYNKERAINSPKPGNMVSYDAVCVKIVLSDGSI